MGELPNGVRVIPLDAHRDDRGAFIEIFRSSWSLGREPVQWNLVRSRPGTIRGVHVHVVHSNYLTVVEGSATFGFKDLRRESITRGLAVTVPLHDDEPALVVIPRGVAHGFMFHAPSIHVYAVSHYRDSADELGCAWNDPALGIRWPLIYEPRLSDRDRRAGTLNLLMEQLNSHQSTLYGPAPD